MTDQNTFYFSWELAALAGAVASPGIYAAPDVPLSPAVGRLGRGPTSTAVATSITSVSTRRAGS